MANNRDGVFYAKNQENNISTIYKMVSWVTKEKDSLVKATLKMINFLFYRINKLVSLVNEIYSIQPFGSIPKLRSFSRQASLTHALKLPFPATKSICSSSSSSKRMCFIVLPERSNDFFSFFSCIGNYRRYNEFRYGNYHILSKQSLNVKITMPRSAGTPTRHLTTNDNDSIEVAMYQYTFPTGKGKARLSEIPSMPLISIQEVSHA